MSFYFPDGKGGRRLVQVEASIPAADTTVKGGVIVTGNDGLIMDGDTLKVNYPNATTSQAGLMSASDKSKLDGLNASSYVATVSGKGLSTEDYTTADKNKLASITVSGGNVVIDTSNLVTKTDYANADRDKLRNLASITTAGENITITNGTIKASSYALPTAGRDTKGGIKITGDGLRVVDDYLGVVVGEGLGHAPSTQEGAITLATASATQKGGIKVNGNGLAMNGDTLICTVSSTTYNDATATTRGLMAANDKSKLDNLASITTAGNNITITNGIIYSSDTKYIAGENITISGGTIKAAGYELPIATSSAIGGVRPGAGVSVQPSSGYLNVNLGGNLSLTSDNKIDINTVSSAKVYIAATAFDSIMSNFATVSGS